MDELPAGRELDALVAERVLGLRIDDAWFQHPDGRRVSSDGLPHYSTDIAAAWQVVDKLLTYSCDFELERAGKL
jgi:hypothetical protein